MIRKMHEIVLLHDFNKLWHCYHIITHG